jgi:uncharacterized protein
MDITITGYAAVFNSPTVIAGLFREQIAPGAFTESLARRDDTRALFNHNPDYLLGRRVAGTLHLEEDSTGLRYRVTLNKDDPMAMGVAAKVQRGDLTGSSFGFAIDHPDDEEWTAATTRNGLPLRILRRLRVIDVSPVVFPAYTATSVTTRRVDVQMPLRRRARARIQLARARGAVWR